MDAGSAERGSRASTWPPRRRPCGPIPVARGARDRATAWTAAEVVPFAVPSRDQWPLFQDVGEQLHAAGCDGLLYHSAARPGGLCLCVFRANATAASGRLEPLARARRVSRPPTPPRGLRT